MRPAPYHHPAARFSYDPRRAGCQGGPLRIDLGQRDLSLDAIEAVPLREAEGAQRFLERLRARPGMAVWAAHVATLVAGAGVLAAVNRHNWFLLDEWDPIDRALHPLSISNLFSPHNEHWSTVPFLEYRILFHWFGLRTYWPYLAVLLAGQLLVAHLLWRVMLRAGVESWIATGLAGVFMVLGAGAQNLLNAWQVSFVGSVLFGLAALLVGDVSSRRLRPSDALVSLLLLLSLMSSGIGITMLVFVGLTIGLRRGWRIALAIVSVPFACLLAWFAGIGRAGLTGDHLNSSLLLGLPDYVWKGLTSAFESLSGIPGSGAALLLAMLALAIVARWCEWPRTIVAATGVVAAVFLYVMVGLGRVDLGVGEAASSRYAYVAIALLMVAIGLGLGRLGSAGAASLGSLLVFLGFVAASNVGELRTYSHQQAVMLAQSRENILAGAWLVRSGERLIGNAPDPTYSPQLTTDDLRKLVQRGDLPSLQEPAQTALASAQAQLLVASSPRPLSPVRPLPILSTTNLALRPAGFGCDVARPTAQVAMFYVALPSAAAIKLVPGAGGLSTVQVQDVTSAGSPGPLSAPRYIDVNKGSTTYLSFTRGGMRALVGLPTNRDSLVCGLVPLSPGLVAG